MTKRFYDPSELRKVEEWVNTSTEHVVINSCLGVLLLYNLLICLYFRGYLFSFIHLLITGICVFVAAFLLEKHKRAKYEVMKEVGGIEK